MERAEINRTFPEMPEQQRPFYYEILEYVYGIALEGKTAGVTDVKANGVASINPRTLTLYVDSLIKAGYLVPYRNDPKDSRRVFVRLSDDARARVESVTATMMKATWGR